MEALVSVIIPYYNSKTTIERAINSVLNQTYKNFEIILIDDGSIDSSFEFVEKIIFNNKIKNVINLKQQNTGPARARNNASRKAKGKYIAFLDADDSWDKNKLKIQMEYLNNDNRIGILGCDCKVVNNDGEIYCKSLNVDKFKEITFYKRLFKNYFCTPSTIMKLDLFNKIGGFDKRQKYAEDSLLFTKALRISRGGKVNLPLVTLYKQPFGDSGLSKNIKLLEKYELRNFKILKIENYKNTKKINEILYYSTIVFSYIKYLRRVFLVKIRRLKK